MSIDFKEEMYFSEITEDFVEQLKNYLRTNIELSIVDVEGNINKLIRVPRTMINFLIDGFGKDANNEASFINYIQTEFGFVYSSNTNITQLISIPGVNMTVSNYEFKKLYKDSKTLANSATLFKEVDILPQLLNIKLGIRFNERLAFKTCMMLSDFINAYMTARGIKMIKVEQLDANGNPILVTDDTINHEFIYRRNIYTVSDTDGMTPSELTSFENQIGV